MPDGEGVGTSTAEVRAERSGTKKAPGDGRVYHIDFTAIDVHGYFCGGTVAVSVPHNVGRDAVDGGALHDSTVPSVSAASLLDEFEWNVYLPTVANE